MRAVADYRRNVEALQPKPTFASTPGGALAMPYVRWHPPLPGMYDDKPPEYDVDDADEAWIAKANAAAAAEAGGTGGKGAAAGGRGIMAAARGLYATVASRFRSSSGGSAMEAAAAAARDADTDGGSASDGAGPVGVSVEQFERAIEKLELLHFAALGKWWSDLNDGGWVGGWGGSVQHGPATLAWLLGLPVGAKRLANAPWPAHTTLPVSGQCPFADTQHAAPALQLK